MGDVYVGALLIPGFWWLFSLQRDTSLPRTFLPIVKFRPSWVKPYGAISGGKAL